MTVAKFSLPLLGAVAIACAAGLLMSQSGQISPAAQISVPRQCVVNICQLAPATGGQLVLIPPGGHYVVRTVPTDMWLTISQMESSRTMPPPPRSSRWGSCTTAP